MSKKKVLCAMSGGVDSSVAAALLKRDGYDVIGVFMKLWVDPSAAQNSKEAFSAAKRTADILGIPFYTLDFEKKFKAKIVDNFVREYGAGRTPNPCVRCNKFIKLGMFFKQMGIYGADYAASGHYARVKKTIKQENKKTRKQENKKTIKQENTPPSLTAVGQSLWRRTKLRRTRKTQKQGAEYEIDDREGQLDFKLLRAKDKNKDQSYFLYNLDQEKLKKLLFPVGEYTKSEVRGLARDFKLPVHDKKESQEVCFTGGRDHYGFLNEHLEVVKGDIFTVDGKKAGRHNGLPFYTIGQRRGIEIGGTGPYYVVKLDFKKNRLIVSGDINHPALMRSFLVCRNVNWVSGQIPELPLKCKARCRYRQREVAATVSLFMAPQSSAERLRRSRKSRYGQREVMALVSFAPRSGRDGKLVCRDSRGAEKLKYLVKFKEPQFAITAGQSVVFYRGDEVLGGGVIV